MTRPTAPAGTAPAGTTRIEVTRTELVTITDALALLAVEHHRQRVLARSAPDEHAARTAETDVDTLRARLEQQLRHL
jgi:hypothetical protein